MQKTAYEMRISDWSSDVCSSDLAPAVRSDRLSRCRPSASKFAGSSHRVNAAFSTGHPPSTIENQAVSRLRPLYMVACRNSPSYWKPSRAAAVRDGAFRLSHFQIGREHV